MPGKRTHRERTVSRKTTAASRIPARTRSLLAVCPSVRIFAPRFLQTPPRGDALALRYPSPHQAKMVGNPQALAQLGSTIVKFDEWLEVLPKRRM